MAPLNPKVIIAVGLMVAVSSYFIQHMQFFVYVGIALFVYGLLRLYILGSKKEYMPKKPIQHYHARAPMPSQAIRCARCRMLLKPQDYFCPRCGQMQRRN